jgi:protein-disulfide isomerase
MKNVLIIVLCLLLAVDIFVQGASLYRRYNAQKPDVISVKVGTRLDLTNHPIQGNVNAPNIIVEFGDFECPFCLRHAKETLPILKQKYIDRGMIRYAYVNTPLPVHPNAKLLAAAAICAGKQNQYWEMHDELIEKKPNTRSEVTNIAVSLGLESLAFDACLTNGASEKQINTDLQQAKDLGLREVPCFAVGTIQPDGKVLVRKLIIGAQSVKVFERAIAE